MKSALATAAIIAAALAGLAWYSADAGSGPAGEERAPAAEQAGVTAGQQAAGQAARGGSSLPCAVPLAWRVGRVDREFGVTADEARAAARAAAALWERGMGTRLFVYDPRDGFPIRLVHDERQAAATERRRVEEELRAVDRRLDARRHEIERLARDHQRDAAAYEARTRALGERVAAHNRAVRAWNERGGAPGDTVRALTALGLALDAEGDELERWRQDLEAASRRINEQQLRLNAEIEDHNRHVERMRHLFPAVSVQSGIYGEEARIERGRVVAISRRIEVFRFDDADDLVRVIAHEMGHALGLGHVDAPGALMSDEYGRDAAAPRPALDPRDIALLRARCPGL